MKTIDERVEKIENWLQFEQGNFMWEIFTVLLKYGAFFYFAYLLFSVMMSTMTVTLIEQLPLFCENINYGNI